MLRTYGRHMLQRLALLIAAQVQALASRYPMTSTCTEGKTGGALTLIWHMGPVISQ